MSLTLFVFWLSLFLLGYLYAGYPLAAWIRARLFTKRHPIGDIEPTVTVVVVAYNEEDRIDARIQNLLDCDYPRTQLQIVIASDGSTDKTVERARAHASRGVVVHSYPWRRGK